MKISDVNSLNRLIQAGTGQEHSVPKSGAGSSFREVISGLTQQNAAEVLGQMCRDIEAQGALLARRYDIMELKRYKKLLADFLYEAVRLSYEYKQGSSRDGRGRHKMYSIIKRINEKLEKMTADILSGQTDALQLMADIDDINGMIVDLTA